MNSHARVNAKAQADCLRWLRALAAETGAFRVGESTHALKTTRRSSAVSWDYRIAIAPIPTGASFDLLVDVQERISPQVAIGAIHNMLAAAGGEGVPTLCSPIISPRVAAMCGEAGVGYFDADGNADIRGPGLVLHRTGQPRRHQVGSAPADPFATRSSRIVRALLSAPEKSWGVLELGAAAGVSAGLVSRVKDVLLAEAYLEQADDGLCLRRPRELLEAWLVQYKPPGPPRHYYVMATPQEAEARVAAWSAANGVAWALASFSGAWRGAPMVRYHRATVYLDADLSEVDLVSLERGIQAKVVDTGSNLAVVLISDPAVFFGARFIGSERVVSPLQLYLDLANDPRRGAEAAQAVYDKDIGPMFDRVRAPREPGHAA